ncbi:GIY-YIG nuclease family protein, partial [candidate division WWE3 bacterium]|nr:GIY-YIG nuclease family protein [candidate division WWE3 bacterium]
MRGKHPAIYILSNKTNIVLYTGVTTDLNGRTWKHNNVAGNSFTSKYNVNKLVYYEFFDTMEQAIAREKQIKGGSRV